MSKHLREFTFSLICPYDGMGWRIDEERDKIANHPEKCEIISISHAFIVQPVLAKDGQTYSTSRSWVSILAVAREPE